MGRHKHLKMPIAHDLSANPETDRPLEIGNLRKMFAWGEHFPQIANRPCSVCHGDMALTDANPAFGPTEQGIMLELSELDRFGAIWIDSDTFEKLKS